MRVRVRVCVCLCACSQVWVLGVFVLSGKFRRVPHFITTCLIVSQVRRLCHGRVQYAARCVTLGHVSQSEALHAAIGII